MAGEHWHTYRSYNTTEDAVSLLDVAEQMKILACDQDEEWEQLLATMADAVAGIGQRLSRMDSTYPYPDPIPEHWGPKPEGL